MERKEVGKVTHYFNKIGVAVLELSGTLKQGDKIAFEKAGFEQAVDSMQIDKQTIEQADAGQSIGLKVSESVTEGDTVYLVTE